MRYSTEQLKEIIRAAAARYGIDPEIGIRQLARESVNFNPHYVYGPGKSPAGAQGMAQFIPGTWARYGHGSPYDPVAAADAWGRYMRDLLRMFNGRYDLALAGYNWGEHRNTLRTALASGQSILNYSIPSETRGYVAAILASATPVAPVVTTPAPVPRAEPVLLYPLVEPIETGSIFGGGVGAVVLVGGTLATLWWLIGIGVAYVAITRHNVQAALATPSPNPSTANAGPAGPTPTAAPAFAPDDYFATPNVPGAESMEVEAAPAPASIFALPVGRSVMMAPPEYLGPPTPATDEKYTSPGPPVFVELPPESGDYETDYYTDTK